MFAMGDACPDNVISFNACPPSRRFSPTGNQSLFNDFVDPTGVTLDWRCGHTSGLKLRDKPRILLANLTANLSEGFSISLWFQPGNTSALRLQSILSISTLENEVTVAGCYQNLLQIGQYGAFLLLRYRDALEKCRIRLLQGAVLHESTMVKLVFATDESLSRTFYDGALIDQSTGMKVSPSQNTNQARQIRLFGSVDNDIDAFHGALYHMAFTNETFSNQQVGRMNDTCFDNMCARRVFHIHSTIPDTLLIPQGTLEPRTVSIPWPDIPSVMASITSLPERGVLQQDGIPVVSLGSTFDQSTKVEYVLTDTAFFSSPHINVYGVDQGLSSESFTFELVAFDDDGFLVARSSEMELSIQVLLVNHRPMLQGPTDLKPTGNALEIFGLELLDADLDMNLVRVDVVSQKGRITVPTQEARSQMRQHACDGRTASPWQCQGDGVDNRRLVFVAAPSDVGHILNHLTYKTLVPSRPEPDNLTVTVYDGEGGDCLTASEHWDYQAALGNLYPSLHVDGCMSVQVIIPIDWEPVGHSNSGQESSSYDKDSKIPDILFWVLCIITLLYLFRKQVKKCAIRGSAIDADDGDASAVQERNDSTARNPPHTNAAVATGICWEDVVLA